MVVGLARLRIVSALRTTAVQSYISGSSSSRVVQATYLYMSLRDHRTYRLPDRVDSWATAQLPHGV